MKVYTAIGELKVSDDSSEGHVIDPTDAHSASAISIADAANDFTATEVEGALAELQADNEAHVAAADPHTGYLKESVLAGPGNADPLADATAAAAGAATWASREDHVHPDTKLATHAAAADPHTGYLKESNTIDFLVGTATAELAGEIVVGATPGGELGNTWASPTVDASHAGSTHAAAQAAAEATAAAAAATHAGAADPHTGYRLESADHSHATTGLQGGTIDHGAITGLGDDDHPQYALDTDLSTHAGAADPHTGYLKESATIDFLVGTAHGDLASEIVVGATPGGELGGTWASPTVDATHSGSAHHAQAHGAADHADITRSLWVPIPGAADTGTFAYLGTAPDRTAVINLADGATSGFPITFTVPADWAGGALSFKWFIGGSTNFNAADTLRITTDYLEVVDSAQTPAAGTTATTNVDPGTGYVANDLFIWTDPNTITPAAVNNYIRGFIQRIGANAADDYTGIMRVFGLRVDYTANQ